MVLIMGGLLEENVAIYRQFPLLIQRFKPEMQRTATLTESVRKADRLLEIQFRTEAPRALAN